MGKLGPAPGVVPALNHALSDGDVSVRKAAIESLGAMGPPALIPLSRALSDADESARQAAVASLGRLGVAAIVPLSTALSDASDGVRAAAVTALDGIGENAASALLPASEDRQNVIRAAATRALGRYSTLPPVASRLLSLARNDSSPDVRRAALAGLGNLSGTTSVEPVLGAALDDNDFTVRLAAVEAIGHYGPGGVVIESLLPKLASDDLQPAVAAVLAGFGSAAVPRLIAAQADANPKVRAAAAEILVGLGPPVVDPLAAALRRQEPRLRQSLVAVLGRIRPLEAVLPALVASLANPEVVFHTSQLLVEFGRESVRPLIEALGHCDERVREAATKLLSRFGMLAMNELADALADNRVAVRAKAVDLLCSLGPAALPVLTRVIEKGTYPAARVAAVEALGRIGPTAEVVRTLIDVQFDRRPEARQTAISVLNSFGPGATPALIETLRNAPLATRRVALKALSRLGTPQQSTPSLLQALQDSALRLTAIESLGEIGPPAKAAAAELCAVVRRGSVADQTAAIVALGRIGPVPGVVATLVERLFAPTAEIRDAAATALHGFGPAAAPDLVRALQDPNQSVRLVAAQTLGRVAAPEKAVPALIQALADASLRPTAAAALGQIGAPAIEAVPSLEYMLRVGDPSEKQVAFDALRRITGRTSQPV